MISRQETFYYNKRQLYGMASNRIMMSAIVLKLQKGLIMMAYNLTRTEQETIKVFNKTDYKPLIKNILSDITAMIMEWLNIE